MTQIYDVQTYLDALQPVPETPALTQRLLGLIDLTSLNPADTEASIGQFFTKARTPSGHVAAVCVDARFARLAVAEFQTTPIKVATVANFPGGQNNLDDVLAEISQAMQMGVQEIDVVFPYQRFLAGDKNYAHDFVLACKAAAGDKTVKVILETGMLNNAPNITEASEIAILAGADFIKTSTGKTPVGATLEAAAVMLLTIKHLAGKNHPAGLKVSGGIRHIPQAAQYVALADQIMGREWVDARTFRIGASQLIDELLS